MSAEVFETPRLLADIGGTNARFALETAPRQFAAMQVLPCADHATITDAIRHYLAVTQAAQVREAAIAIANPVNGDHIAMTNHHWQFSIEALRAALGFKTLLVFNDFHALAMSLPQLDAADLRPIGGGKARENSVIGLVGPGTGLGVSGLVPTQHGWAALATEGGHVTFAPADDREAAVRAFAQREFAHVSAERLISGPGLVLIQHALCELESHAESAADTASEVARRAQAGDGAASIEAARMFSGMLGSFAGNVALTLGATGGLYLGGGVIGGLATAFDRARFRERFVAKGRFERYLESIPTLEITAANPALLGVSALLAQHLRA